MIIGAVNVTGVEGDYICKNVEAEFFTDVGDFCIWSNGLMPNIPFGEKAITPSNIDKNFFLNASTLSFPSQINTQNFKTAKYVGRAPLEYYGDPTEIGREFLLHVGNEIAKYNNEELVFGTQDAMSSYNKNASDMEAKPKIRQTQQTE